MTTTTLYIPLPDGTEAKLEITVAVPNDFPMEPNTFREPTGPELNLIGQALLSPAYRFHSALD